ncbi:MAG: hypothetical protein ACXQTY_07165 [Candidatus Methanogasteraceae archaeon]
MAGAISIEKSAEVMEKAFTILRQRLNAEEYLIYLQVITLTFEDVGKDPHFPKIFDSKRLYRSFKRLVPSKPITIFGSVLLYDSLS